MTLHLKLLGVALFLAGAVGPQTSALAGDLDGSWRGGGTMTLSSGANESVRCRAEYTKESDRTYSLDATCTTGATRVRQSAELDQITASAYRGTFHNTEYGVTGSIYVRVNGSSQTVRLKSDSGTASLNLTKR